MINMIIMLGFFKISRSQKADLSSSKGRYLRIFLIILAGAAHTKCRNINLSKHVTEISADFNRDLPFNY